MKYYNIATAMLVVFTFFIQNVEATTQTKKNATQIEDARVKERRLAAEQAALRLANRYTETKEKFIGLDLSSRKILGNLYSINKKMKKITKKRARLTNKMLYAKGSVKNTARDIADLELKIKDQTKLLRKRMRALYILGGEGIMQVLFSSTNSHDFDQNMKYLKIISDRDYELIKSYKNNLRELNHKRDSLKKEVQTLVRLRERVKSQEDLLTQEQSSKSVLLNRLRKEREQYLSRLSRLRKHGQKIAEEKINPEIARLLKGAFFERKGQLIEPIDGIVQQDYGLIEDPEYGFQLRFKGRLYNVSYKTPYLAVANGEVSFVGKVQGYDNTVILDHGDHYYTVYASSGPILVKPGQQVSEGQKLGIVDPTRLTKAKGLYFEVRHFSEAEDPAHWLKSGQLKKTASR